MQCNCWREINFEGLKMQGKGSSIECGWVHLFRRHLWPGTASYEAQELAGREPASTPPHLHWSSNCWWPRPPSQTETRLRGSSSTGEPAAKKAASRARRRQARRFRDAFVQLPSSPRCLFSLFAFPELKEMLIRLSKDWGQRSQKWFDFCS